jgi:hypothetical protein
VVSSRLRRAGCLPWVSSLVLSAHRNRSCRGEDASRGCGGLSLRVGRGHQPRTRARRSRAGSDRSPPFARASRVAAAAGTRHVADCRGRTRIHTHIHSSRVSSQRPPLYKSARSARHRDPIASLRRGRRRHGCERGASAVRGRTGHARSAVDARRVSLRGSRRRPLGADEERRRGANAGGSPPRSPGVGPARLDRQDDGLTREQRPCQLPAHRTPLAVQLQGHFRSLLPGASVVARCRRDARRRRVGVGWSRRRDW